MEEGITEAGASVSREHADGFNVDHVGSRTEMPEEFYFGPEMGSSAHRRDGSSTIGKSKDESGRGTFGRPGKPDEMGIEEWTCGLVEGVEGFRGNGRVKKGGWKNR